MDAGSRSLAFLLSLGAVPLACAGDDGSDSDAATTSGTINSTAGATTTSTTTEATTLATIGESSGESSGATDPTGTTTDDPDGACESYWAKLQACEPREWTDIATYIDQCNADLELRRVAFGRGCADAHAAYLECYGALSCAELMMGEPCATFGEAAAMACSVIPGPTCLDFGDKAAMCDPRTGADAAALHCQDTIHEGILVYGEACGLAYEEYFACLTALTCAEIGGGMACDRVDLAPCDRP